MTGGKRFREWFDGRTLRERAVLTGAVIVLLAVFVYLGVFDPLAQRQRQVQQELTHTRNSLQELTAREMLLRAREKTDPDADMRERINTLQAESDRLQAMLESNIDNLVSPRQMTHLLEDLLKRQQSLQLLSLNNLPPRTMTAASGARDSGEAPELFVHGLEMELAGTYRDLLNYLQQLQNLPRALVWDTVEIETTEYPAAIIRLQVYTLSLTEGWIGG